MPDAPTVPGLRAALGTLTDVLEELLAYRPEAAWEQRLFRDGTWLNLDSIYSS